jgi:hypothetical protein
MLMAADVDVARRRKSAHNQRRMQGRRGQRGHLRQRCSCRCSCHSRRQYEGVNPGAEVSHVRPRSKVVSRRQLLLAVLCKCIKPLTLHRARARVQTRGRSPLSDVLASSRLHTSCAPQRSCTVDAPDRLGVLRKRQRTALARWSACSEGGPNKVPHNPPPPAVA